MDSPRTRVERDPLGPVEVPAGAYYGAQTQRAVENFPISGRKLHPEFNRALAFIKKAAALANVETGDLEERLGQAIVRAADEILEGRFEDHFVVDAFQAGAGTSQHMNMNEVLANRASELLGGRLGDYSPVHPNDHVNMGQSSNDVTPTAIRLAALALWQALRESLLELEEAFRTKAGEFDGILKAGRTHLQDAVPIRLGQEFGAYAHSIRRASERIEEAARGVGSLNLGASAVGTGLNTDPRYRELAVGRLARLTGLAVRPAENLFEVTQSMADLVEMSGALRGLAMELARIANDLRLLSSGPRTGLDEISLPTVQPGSSIMPGKVNPVMAEMMDMVAFEVMGNDLTVSLAGQAGQLDLNVMTPVIACGLLDSMEILTNSCRVFARRCVAGIEPHPERLQFYADATLGLATALNPYIGYQAAAEIAKESLATGKTIRELVTERGLLSAEQAAEILSPWVMTEPRRKKSTGARG